MSEVNNSIPDVTIKNPTFFECLIFVLKNNIIFLSLFLLFIILMFIKSDKKLSPEEILDLFVIVFIFEILPIIIAVISLFFMRKISYINDFFTLTEDNSITYSNALMVECLSFWFALIILINILLRNADNKDDQDAFSFLLSIIYCLYIISPFFLKLKIKYNYWDIRSFFKENKTSNKENNTISNEVINNTNEKVTN